MSLLMPIDFAPRSAGQAWQRAPLWAWAAGLAGLLLCLHAGWSWQAQQRNAEALRHELARQTTRLNLATQADAERQHQSQATGLSAPAAEALARALNAPWGGLLNALERAQTPNVALLELQPDVRNGRVRGQAEARHSAAMLAYVQALKEQPELAGAWLRSHSQVESPEGVNVLRFEFELDWPEGRR
jgi:hypothetical protein